MKFPTKSVIESLGITARKSRGQNFLIERNIAEKIVDCAAITSNDVVVEIGPGPGALTGLISDHAAQLHCFEIDRDMCRLLTDTCMFPNMHVYNQDILAADFHRLRPAQAHLILVGSIPYNITGQILIKFLGDADLFSRALFIVQHEVALRLCAGPGSRDYGILSVLCRAYAPAQSLFTIPAACFYPMPKVDSAAVMLVPDRSHRWNHAHEMFFQRVVRTAFSKRRKTLRNCLKPLSSETGITPETLEAGAARAGIDLQRRAETLSLNEFYVLAELLLPARQPHPESIR